MGFIQRRGRNEDDQLPAPGALDDLEPLACPVCRRDLHPWETSCPDDGAPAVPRSTLPPRHPPPPAHLLDDEET